MVAGICMNDYLILREDIKIGVEDNLIKIKATPVYGNEDTLVFISKSQAVILLLFDGTASVGGICEKVARLFNTDLEKGEYTILKTLELFSSLLTPLNGGIPKSNFNLIKAKNVMELADNKTVIFISHRLSTTKSAHRIFFFENGRITEEGTHDELMQTGGKYAQMFNLQASKYVDQDIYSTGETEPSYEYAG